MRSRTKVTISSVAFENSWYVACSAGMRREVLHGRAVLVVAGVEVGHRAQRGLDVGRDVLPDARRELEVLALLDEGPQEGRRQREDGVRTGRVLEVPAALHAVHPGADPHGADEHLAGVGPRTEDALRLLEDGHAGPAAVLVAERRRRPPRPRSTKAGLFSQRTLMSVTTDFQRVRSTPLARASRMPACTFSATAMNWGTM